jgi:hypothetical protein
MIERGTAMTLKRKVGFFHAAVCSFIIIGIILVSGVAKAGNEELYGTWRLVSNKRMIVATGETMDTFGKSPNGYISYGRDGRMFVLIVRDNRPKPPDLAKMTDQERAELFKTMIAYGGTYTYDGKTVVHHVDISWNENWTGTDSEREVKFEGNRLMLSTHPHTDPIDGKITSAVVTWERIK